MMLWEFVNAAISLNGIDLTLSDNTDAPE